MKNLAFWIGAAALIWGVVAIASETGDEGRMPDFDGAVAWLNSPPLSSKSLRGKVVLVNFWTYSCINSLRELPYMKAWAAKYKGAGLVVIGVHAPEFGFEKDPANVKNAVFDLKVAYPIPIDSNHSIWRAFRNEYWPADYFVDAKGRIRYHHFGEGEYEKSERVIQTLLRENGATGLDESTVRTTADGAEAPPSEDVRSPETYVGYTRVENFASPERMARDAQKIYSPPARPALNQWGFGGSWNAGAGSGTLESAPGKIVFRFDCDYYRRRYPEAVRAGHNPLVHFLAAPAKKGLQPHPLFSTTYYLTKYSEVSSSGLNPLVHYVLDGAAAGYQPNPLFEPAFYRSRYGDNSLIHYLLHGRIDRRKPHPWFDAGYYLSQRLDARCAGRNPLEDFFEAGSGEHVSPHPLFDYEAYLRAHPDTEGDALAAFLESGCRCAAPAEGGLFDCERES